MFRVPPTSKYDLNFTVLGFPVRVSPAFWLIMVLFGLFNYQNPFLILIWVLVAFFSILIHEMGHGLVMRLFGQDSYLVLYGFGGLAVPVSSRWGGSTSRTPVEQVIISLAGPIAGFLLAGLVMLSVLSAGGTITINWLLFIIPIPSASVPGGIMIVDDLVSMLIGINVFWGLVNLLPVLPLDGGHVSQSLFVMADPWEGPRKALWLSIIVGAVVAVLSFVLLNSIYMAFLFGILALQSYALLQGRGGMGF